MFKGLKKIVLVGSTLVVSSSAFAEGDSSAVDQIFNNVDLTTVVAFVISMGGIIIGISLAEKGIAISKRNIKKA